MSLREKILAAEDRPFRDVPTPEWAGNGVPTARVITMAAADRDTWEAEAMLARTQLEGTARLRNMRAALVVRCLVDPESGERIFSDQDVEPLGQKSAKVIDRLFAVATDLNAVTDEDMKALEKNFSGGRSGASHSVLRWLQAASMWIGSFRNSPVGKSPSGSSLKDSKATP